MSKENDTKNNLSDIQLLDQIDQLYLEVNSTKGTNAKIEVFKEHPKALPLIDIIWNPNPIYKTGITQKGMDKFIEDKASKISEYKKSRHESIHWGLVETFMALINKTLTGDTARSKVATLMAKYNDSGYSELIRDIMSRKQTTRVGYKNVAKAFPDLWTDSIADSLGTSIVNTSGKQFKDLVELGKSNSFDEHTIILHINKLIKKGYKVFYFSLKMDGLNCRLIIIGDNAHPEDLSKVIIDAKTRSGNSYTSLSLLTEDARKNIVKNLTKTQLREGIMIVGEIRVKTEGQEDDFRGTLSAGRKKDSQMENFRYDVYDFIPLPLFWEGQGYTANNDPDFKQRYELLAAAIPDDTDIIKVVPQHLYTAKDLSAAIVDTQKYHQEGLVIREAHEMYVGKRHNLFIKYKNYWNEEYKVDDIECENMEIKVNAKTGASESHFALKNIIFSIDDTNEGKYKKGTKNIVHVGSGFTPDERIEYAKDPSKILDMWVTVKHYGVTENSKGTRSLRQGIFLNLIGKKERDY